MTAIVVLAAYAALMIGATVCFTRKQTTLEGFLVGDRNMRTVSSAMSIAATWIWAPALFTSAEQAYIHGIPGLFWFIVPNVLCLLLFIPFAKQIRAQMPDGITLSGYMHQTYRSRRVKNIYFTQLTALTVLSTAVQLLAGGKILSSVTGLSFPVMVLLLSIIAYSYSWFSGIKASVLTDSLQMILILITCALFVPWGLHGNLEGLERGFGGVSGEFCHLFDGKGLEVFFAFGLPTAIGLMAGPFGDQCFWQRAFSVRRIKLTKAFLLGSVLFAVVPLSMGVLGYIAAGTGYIAADSGMVNLELITHLFPAWTVLSLV